MYSYTSVIFVAILVLLSSSSDAFAPSKIISSSKVGISSSTLSAFPPLPDFLQSDETLSPAIEAARTKFWFYFFAGSGAGGVSY